MVNSATASIAQRCSKLHLSRQPSGSAVWGPPSSRFGLHGFFPRFDQIPRRSDQIRPASIRFLAALIRFRSRFDQIPRRFDQILSRFDQIPAALIRFFFASIRFPAALIRFVFASIRFLAALIRFFFASIRFPAASIRFVPRYGIGLEQAGSLQTAKDSNSLA